MSDERVETVRSRILTSATAPSRTSGRFKLAVGAGVLTAAAAAVLVWTSSNAAGIDVAVAPVEHGLTAPASATHPATAKFISPAAETKHTVVASTSSQPLIIARDGRSRFVHEATSAKASAAVRIGDDVVRFHGDVELVTTKGTLRQVIVRSGKAEVSKVTGATSPHAVVVAGSSWRAKPLIDRTKLILPLPPKPAAKRPNAKADRSSLLDAKSPAIATTKPNADEPDKPDKPDDTRTKQAKLNQTPAERAFGKAWTHLRNRRYHEAATGFASALRSRGASNIAEDARYWRAVALRRIGTSAGARAAMTAFLNRHGSTRRADRIRVMLGWLLLEGGQTKAARALFKRAARSSMPEVSKAARDGLKRSRKPASK